MATQLFLNTRDGVYQEPYNMLWQIKRPRISTAREYRLALTHVEVPNAVYPINEYNNQVYYVDVGVGTTVNVALTVGSYTYNEFITMWNATVGAAGPTITAYDDKTHYFEFTSANANEFYFEQGDNDVIEVIGVKPDTSSTTLVLSSEYPINLSGSQYFDILSDFSTHNYTTTQDVNILARIPLIVGFGNVLYWQASTDETLYVTSDTLDQVHVYLRDDHGNPWKLPKTAHMSLVLKILMK